jgi:hypothetical protein
MNSQQPLGIFTAPGWQDKAPPTAEPATAIQPRSAIQSQSNRPKHHGSEKRQKDHMSTRVPPHVRLAYIQIAKKRGGEWTPSSVLAEAAEEWLEQSMGEQFAQRISNVVERTIDKNYQNRDKHFAQLLAKIFYVTEFFRLLFIRFLGLTLFAGNKEALDELTDDLEKEAKDNIKKPIKILHGN